MAGYKLAGKQVVCIPCEFVDFFIKDVNPTYVTVYLYGFRQCFSANPKGTVSDVASALGILESDVIRAWRYWESRGIVTLTYNSESNPSDFSVEFADLSGMCPASCEEEEKDVRPSYKLSDIATRQKDDNLLKEMYKHAEVLLDKTLTQNDIITLYGFYDWLKLPVEVILMIIEHCVSLGKKSTRYMEAVALSWSDMGICTAEKASEHLKALEKSGKAKRRFKKLLGIGGRDFTDAEYSRLLEWSENMGFSDEMIKLAYEKTVLNTGKISFQYMHAILSDWHAKGITTDEQTRLEVAAPPKKQVAAVPRNRFNSYTQSGNYTDEEIERLVSNSSITVKEG